MIWAILLFLYFYWLFVLAPERGINILGFGSTTAGNVTEPMIGFWRSCLELPGIPGPQGPISSPLNEAAARYVATVYGYQHLPQPLRKSWAGAVFLTGVSAYTLIVLVLANAPFGVFGYTLATVGVILVAALMLGSVVFWKTRKAGIPFSKEKLALREIEKIRHSPLSVELDDAFQNIGPQSIIWWPYPLGKGRYFRYTLRLLLITLPASYALLSFLQAHAFHESHVYVHGLLGTTLVLAALAIEWILLVSALIWWGDWKGAEKSTWRSFSLQILLNDLEDLAG